MSTVRPTLYIDADACPVTAAALSTARKNALPVVIAGNSTQNLESHIKRGDPRNPVDGFWVTTLPVMVGADSADFAIIERLEAHDIVVTQDIGLAAMALGRKAYAISVRGREFLPATIDIEMEMRHIEKKARRQGLRTKGPAAFTEEDREYFCSNLQRLIDKALRAED